MAYLHESGEKAWLSSEGGEKFFCKGISVSGLCQMYRSYRVVLFGNNCVFCLSGQYFKFFWFKPDYVP